VYNGEVHEKHHEAIVSHDLFFYAFERLSPHLLDDSPNPQVEIKKHARYTRREGSTNALLKELIASTEGKTFM